MNSDKKNAQPQTHAEGHITKKPTKVYHIIKAKGNTAMIELKITVNTAEELNQEVKDLYQSIVGAPIKESIEPAAKKAKPVETKPVESETKPVENEIPKSNFEDLGEEVPSLEDTRAFVKKVVTDSPDNKAAFKEFLNEIGAESVTKATDAQRIQIVKWAKDRG